MKILHVPFCFAPDPIGGTEVYVTSLALQLKKRGVEVVIAAPADEMLAVHRSIIGGYDDRSLRVPTVV